MNLSSWAAVVARVPFWLGSDNTRRAERKDGAFSWTALITRKVSCDVWPPADKYKSPVMKLTKYNDKQV